MTPMDGTVVGIVISDPWDLVTEVGDEQLIGKVVSVRLDELLVRLDLKVRVSGTWFSMMRLKPRYHATFESADFSSGKSVPVNVLLEPEDSAVGVVVAIGSVVVAR